MWSVMQKRLKNTALGKHVAGTQLSEQKKNTSCQLDVQTRMRRPNTNQLISDSFANQNLWITNMLDRMQLWIYVD